MLYSDHLQVKWWLCLNLRYWENKISSGSMEPVFHQIDFLMLSFIGGPVSEEAGESWAAHWWTWWRERSVEPVCSRARYSLYKHYWRRAHLVRPGRLPRRLHLCLQTGLKFLAYNFVAHDSNLYWSISFDWVHLVGLTVICIRVTACHPNNIVLYRLNRIFPPWKYW